MNTLLRLTTAGLLLAGALAAQRKGGGGGSQPGMDIQMPRATSRLEQMSDLFKLSKDQKKEVKSIFDEGQKEANPVREELARQRLALGEAVAGGKSQDEIDKLTQAYGTQVAQMTAIESRAFAKVVEILEPEQKQRVANLYRMMAGVFKGKNWDTP